MPNWRYMVIWTPRVDPQEESDKGKGVSTYERMNSFGQDGWEAFAVTPHQNGWHIFYKKPAER